MGRPPVLAVLVSFSLAFGSSSAEALVIDHVDLDSTAFRINGPTLVECGSGVFEPVCYAFDAEVGGIGILNVKLTRPDGIMHDLMPEPEEDTWNFDSEPFTSLADYQAQFSNGNYLVTFNLGETDERSESLFFRSDIQPSDFLNFMAPQHEGAVSTTPTFEWADLSGVGDLLDFDLEDLTINEDLGLDLTLPNTETSFSIPVMLGDGTLLNSLIVGHTYLLDGGPFNELVDTSPGFLYSNEFANLTVVKFSVIPEPSTALLLASGLVAMAMGRRRRGAVR